MPFNGHNTVVLPRLSCSKGQNITATEESYRVRFDRGDNNKCNWFINTLHICFLTTINNFINSMMTSFFIEEKEDDEVKGKKIADVELTFLKEDTVCSNNTMMYCAKHQFESLEINDNIRGFGVTFMTDFIMKLVSSSNGQNLLQLQFFSKIATDE